MRARRSDIRGGRAKMKGEKEAWTLYDPPTPCTACGSFLANDGTAHVVCSPYGADHHALYHPGCCPSCR